MKYQFQIVGAQQYEYVMGEGDFDSPEAAVEAYNSLREAFKEPVGLTALEFDSVVEKMCLGKTVEGGTNLWDKATPPQKWFINSLKRALKRIESKQSKNDKSYDGQVITTHEDQM